MNWEAADKIGLKFCRMAHFVSLRPLYEYVTHVFYLEKYSGLEVQVFGRVAW